MIYDVMLKYSTNDKWRVKEESNSSNLNSIENGRNAGKQERRG